ncbi:MAG: hypothetical protein ACRDZY_11265, partial [Acidimicrobiales bacterium]
LPPAAALARVSGPGAEPYAAARVAGAGQAPEAAAGGVEVLGPSEGAYLVRAPDHATLGLALAAVPRPRSRVRVEVDPRRV